MEGGARIYADESQLGAMTSGLTQPTSSAAASLYGASAAQRAQTFDPFIAFLNTGTGKRVVNQVGSALENTISSWFV